jgi:predicted nucleotidyltransferase
MLASTLWGMASLTELERDCLRRFLTLLDQRLGGRLVEVRMFGSAARGQMWPASAPMHSDIDLLVVTRDVMGEAEKEELVNETYPLFLECGRQISPHFYTERQSAEPDSDRMRAFLGAIAGDVVVVWPEDANTPRHR